MANQTPEELIAAGPSKVETPTQVTPTVDVKVTSSKPTEIRSEQIKDDGSYEDPVKRLAEIVKEKPAAEGKPGDSSRQDSGEDGDSNKTRSDDSARKRSDGEVSGKSAETEDDELPPTARTIKPRPPLEEQIKNEDWTNFSDAEKRHLKNMDRSAREWVIAERRRQIELGEKVKTQDALFPQNWYEHERAYTLHPEYNNAVAVSQRANDEVEYWKSQLEKVREGEKWIDFSPDGKQQFERPPDAKSEVELLSRINRGVAIQQQYAERAQGLIQSFSAERGRVQQAIKAVEDKFFPQYADPKSFEGNRYIKNFDDMLAKFNQQTNPIAGWTRKLYAWALENYDKLQEVTAEQNTKQAIIKDQKRAGPTNGEIAGGKSKPIDPDDKPFDINEFNKLKS